ncbi:MAG: hypothetical protein ACSHX8_14065 [Opitutaceae bacterium]
MNQNVENEIAAPFRQAQGPEALEGRDAPTKQSEDGEAMALL